MRRKPINVMTNDESFWEQVPLIVPKGFLAAAWTAAKRHHMTVPEWCRRMMLRALELDGVRIEEFEDA
jgi:hypothetical protein